ncbi:MAG: SpoIVB peptidase S55 domain-containing protein [Candidatus Brocadiaceae bacterium]|nr:SpoIVB peptidase S55 domain-containing protein [Candidatus Brocadiaceae bacterium]
MACLNKYKIYGLLLTAYCLLLTAYCPMALGVVDTGPIGSGPTTDVFLNVDELRPGMKGYGKTVFSGDKIEEFDVEILGVLKNWETKNDMILVKLSGGPLEKTGVISGMSGSPVYVEDKVIGAVSYGWGFAKEAMAGVTPIKEMLKVLEVGAATSASGGAGDKKGEKELASAPGRYMPSAVWESPLGPHEIDVKEALVREGWTFPSDTSKQPILRMVPIKTPLMVGGFDQRVLKQMSEGLERYGLFPVQGGGVTPPGPVLIGDETAEVQGFNGSKVQMAGSLTAEGGQAETLQIEAVEMVPGAAIATVLAKGDINASAVGTLTYRLGDSILAFGHPFIQAGKTDIPMAGAHVHAVIPIQSTSLKLASPTRIVGRIFQDSKAALAGTLGQFSALIPCTIKVAGDQTVEYNFEVVKDRFLTQNLIQWASESALLATERQAGDKTVRLSLSIEMEGQDRPVKVENIYYEPHPTWFPVYHITQPIALIMNNPFQEVGIKRISLEAKVSDERRLAYIEDIRVETREVGPGETVQLFVTVRPFGKEPVVITVPLQIPLDVSPGSTITVDACNADTSQALERSRAPEKFLPTSLEHLIKILEDAEPNTNLIVRAVLPKRGITYRGKPLPSLPSSLLSIMSFPNQGGIGRLTEELVSKRPVDWILQGSQNFTLTVKEGG